MSTTANRQEATAACQESGQITPNGKLRVVYLAGTGHSGSTLLAILLHAHPRVATVGETSVKPKIRHRGRGAVLKCSCGVLIAECDFWKDVFQRMRERGFELSADRWSNDYRLTHPLLHRLLSRRSSIPGHRQFQDWAASHLPVYSKRVKRVGQVNVAFIRAVLETGKADVFFDASKRLVRLSRLLELPELDVKVIRLLRDVRGYVASAKRRGYSVVDATRSWKQTQIGVAGITSSLPDDRQLLLRYEDLCTSTGDTLSRVYEFCGVASVDPFTSPKLGRHHVIGNSMRFKKVTSVQLDESWRKRLSEDEQRQIMAMAGEMNRGFGYV